MHVRTLIPLLVLLLVSAATWLPDPEDPFSVPSEQINKDIQAGGLSIYTALQEANKGFASLSRSAPRVFIVTGNVLPWVDPIAKFTGGQIEKKIGYYLINLAANSFTEKGFR